MKRGSLMRHERAARQWLGKWKAAEVELKNLDAKTRGLIRRRKNVMRTARTSDHTSPTELVIELSTRIGEQYERHAKLIEKRDRYMRSFAALMREELER